MGNNGRRPQSEDEAARLLEQARRDLQRADTHGRNARQHLEKLDEELDRLEKAQKDRAVEPA